MAALVRAGIKPHQITGLRDLVDPLDRPKAIIRFYLKRRDGRSKSMAERIARTLLLLARDYCQLPENHVAKIAAGAAWVEKLPKQTGLTAKNATRLRALVHPKARAMLLCLPAELMRRAASPDIKPEEAARIRTVRHGTGDFADLSDASRQPGWPAARSSSAPTRSPQAKDHAHHHRGRRDQKRQPDPLAPSAGKRQADRRRLDLERRRPRPLREMASLLETTRLAVSDFALVRQSRWREAIASIFDDPDFLPYLRSLRRIAVTYATHDETGAPGSTNLVKPIYHVAWLASRLRMTVVKPLTPVGGTSASRRRGPSRARRREPSRSWAAGSIATLSDGRAEVAVVVRPVVSTMPAGTTLRVELLAERRGSELRADVTAEAETVHVRVWQDGVEVLDRHFLAAATERAGPARRGDRGRPTRSGGGRGAAARRRAGGRPHRRSRMTADATVVVRPEPRPWPPRRRRPHRDGASWRAVAERGVAHWMTTGGSNPDRHLPLARGTAAPGRACPGTPSRSGGGDDRYVPRDHPSPT